MNRRLLLAGLVCAAVLGAWFVLVWTPKGTELADARARSEAAEVEAANLELRLAALLDAKNDAAQLASTAERLEDAVPRDAAMARFILAANEAADRAGVNFLSMSPAPPAASTTPGVAAEIGLNLQVVGGYFRMLDYLDLMQSLPRIVVFDNINVTPAGSEAAPNDLAVSLTGRLFMSEPPPPPGAALADAASTTTVPSATDEVAAAVGAGS